MIALIAMAMSQRSRLIRAMKAIAKHIAGRNCRRGAALRASRVRVWRQCAMVQV